MAKGVKEDLDAGRWVSAERRNARRDAILDAAMSLLTERGYSATSMQKVAKAARTSKETLYSWFGDKAGLFEALVAREAQDMNDEIVRALEQPGRREPRELLVGFGVDVLRLLLGPRSLAINRAAIAAAGTSPELGRILAAKGRDTTRPLLEGFLAEENEAGRLLIPDPCAAFETLMGLLVRDSQVRMLLGVAEPMRPSELRRRADAAVDDFLRLYES